MEEFLMFIQLIFMLILFLLGWLWGWLWPSLLMLVVVIGAVYFGRKLRNRQEIGDEPPITPQPLPRTQGEDSSNQEEEKIQPENEN